MKVFPLVLLSMFLLLAACDAGQTERPPTGAISPIDGQPIVSMTTDAFARGDALRDARDQVARSYGPEIVAAFHSQSPGKTGQDGSASVLLKDLVIGSGKNPAPHVSTHFAVENDDGYTEHLLLALAADQTEHATSKGTGDTYIVEDPDLVLPDDAYESVSLQAVSLADPTQTAQVTFSEEGVSVEGAPDASVLTLTTIPIVGGDNAPNSLVPEEPCDPEDLDCIPSGGGGGGSGGGSGPIPAFPSYMVSQQFLTLQTLRLDTDNERWSRAEVHVHVQPTDNYSDTQFAKKNEYRFDKAFFSSFTSSVLAGVFFSHNYALFGPAGGPGEGGEHTFNAVLFPHFETTRFYSVPDVNRANVDYHFDQLSYTDWHWNLSPSLGYISDVNQERANGFPMHALTATPWRAVMIEEDNDVRHFATPLDGDWEGDVATYDFSSGTVSDVYTEIDADWSGYRYDDPFTNSGYRRATFSNVQRSLRNGSVQTNARGFQYTFSMRSITS